MDEKEQHVGHFDQKWNAKAC